MKKYLKMTGFILLYCLTYFIFIRLAGMLYFDVLVKLETIGPWFENNVTCFHLLFDAFQIPVFILIFKFIKKESLFKACNFTKIRVKTLLIIIAFGFFTSLFTASFVKLPWVIESLPDIGELLNGRLLAAGPVLFIFWVTIHAAFYREVFFRGMIFNEFRKVFPFTLALIMQGLMQGFLFFSFLNMPLVIYGLLSCILFGLIYAWCKSLWASIAAQIAMDVFLYIWRRTDNHIFNESSAPFILGISILMVLTILVYLKEYAETEGALVVQENKST